jgi:branched-chain amino acid transport system permease protein
MNRLIIGLVLAFLLIFPAFNMPYPNTFLIILFMYVLLAQSYDLLAGYTGYINMGHIAFFGLGAYTFGIIWNKGLSLYFSFFAGALVAVIFAVFISFPFFRLRGAYFSLAAFALIKLMEHLTLNLSWLTQGSDGLKVIEGNRMIPMYYLSLFLVLAVLATTYWITRSRLGLAMVSVREEEQVASDFGVPIQKVKTTAMAMLGGSGVIIGPVVGAVFLFIVEETLWTELAYLHTAAYGLVIVLVGLFMPGGLVRLGPFRRFLENLGLYQEL